jgi:formylmethanofuran dehydrogenase subunit E
MKRTKQFELKECSECGSEYKHYASKKNQLCSPCTTKEYLKRNRLKEHEYKKPYPLNDNARKKRYTKLRQGLNNCETREQKTKFYDEVLKEMQETGIYLWCVDLRHPVKPINPGSGKIGRRPKSSIDYPDTRYMNE